MDRAGLDLVAGFIGGTARRPPSPELREEAKKCFVDWFAVSLAALQDDAAVAVRCLVQRWATQGRATNLYGDRGAAPAMALVNATLSHSLDYDDMHFPTAFHASGPTVAAALAVGADRGCSETEVLDAFVTGYEVGAAMGGEGTGPRLAASGWHPTGVLGHFSAASAAAALLRLDVLQIADALGLAATQAGGLQASGGSMAKPFHVGKAAMNGVMAAELALLGMDANTALLDEPRSGILGSLLQEEILARFDGLGREWQIHANTFKPYAACQLTHAPHEAARGLADGFRPEGLREIRVHVNPLARQVAGRERADTPLEGKFCIAYCVALGLRGHPADLSGFTEERLEDAGLRRLVEITRIVTSDGVERCASRVELDYGAAGTRQAETRAVRGSPERPLTWSDLDEKFLQVVAPVLGARVARRLLNALHNFEQPGRMAEIARLTGRVRMLGADLLAASGPR